MRTHRAELVDLAPRRRVAIVIPVFGGGDLTLLKKRFAAWNGRRSPCDGKTAHLDLVFYVELDSIRAAVASDFETTQGAKCFATIRYLAARPQPSGGKQPHDAYAFYRLFKMPLMADHYDAFFWMHPHVLQVRSGWATKVYEQAVLSEDFWVRGSAAMQTCPANALTSDGDCNGSVNQAFPAVLHININALYTLRDPEFQALVDHAENRHPQVAPDVAIFEELVSTDHPLALKLGKGMRRKLHTVEVHHRQEDPAVSVARAQPGHHVTSLYWAAHAHQYQHASFIINAVAGKKHLKEELKSGEHPNTFFVNEHIGS